MRCNVVSKGEIYDTVFMIRVTGAMYCLQCLGDT